MAVVSGVALSVSGEPAGGVTVVTLTSGAELPVGSVTTTKNGAASPAFNVQVYAPSAVVVMAVSTHGELPALSVTATLPLGNALPVAAVPVNDAEAGVVVPPGLVELLSDPPQPATKSATANAAAVKATAPICRPRPVLFVCMRPPYVGSTDVPWIEPGAL